MTKDRWLLLLALFLVGATAYLLVRETSLPRQQDRRRVFQERLGGIGFGPALNLADCPVGFDPRLGCASCTTDCDVGPVPGGSCFCPHHAGLRCRSAQPPEDETSEESDHRVLPR